MPSIRREPLAAQRPKSEKVRVRRAPPSIAPAAIRTTGVRVDEDMSDLVRKKLGLRLGKFSAHVERVSVRFVDINGPKGGIDTECRVKVVLTGMPSVLAESREVDVRTALDKVGHVIERSVRRALEKAGIGTGKSRGSARGKGAARKKVAAKRADASEPDAKSTITRNLKGRAPRATAALEDSATGVPSRKPTRKSANRAKSGNKLAQRATEETRSPSARAMRRTTPR